MMPLWGNPPKGGATGARVAAPSAPGRRCHSVRSNLCGCQRGRGGYGTGGVGER